VTRTGLGEAIEDAASRLQANLERVNRENANSNATAAISELNLSLEEQFQAAKERAQPGADQFTPGILKRYDDEVERRAKTLPDDESRKVFRDRATAGRDNFGGRAMQWEAGERTRNRVDQFNKSSEADGNALLTADAGSRAALYASQGAAFDQAIEEAELEPSAKQAIRDANRVRRSYSAVQADLRDRPENVQDWLVGHGAGEGGYYQKLRSAESGGRNIGSDTSSAFGPYQFTRGTWSAVIKAHPELNLTDADRFKPQAQEIAIRAFTQDNIKSLRKAGIEPTPVNAYMAHFLGAGGGVAFIRAFKANPNDPASAHVAPAAVAANRGVFKPGRTVADVMVLFGKKFGAGSVDMSGGAPTYYADLSPEKRDALYSQAEAEVSRRRVQGEAAFQQRAQNALAEYGATGSATSAPGESEFVAAFGPNRGTVAYGEFQAKAQGAAAAHRLLNMEPAQHAEFVESQRPKPGDPFFAEKQQAFASVTEAAQRLATERKDDPAGQVIRRFPQAGIDLRDALNPETTDDPAKLDAWANLARVNGSDRLLPNSIRDAMTRNLSRVPVDSREAAVLWEQFGRQRQLWARIGPPFSVKWGTRHRTFASSARVSPKKPRPCC
jgi:hypothetical protein